jgi:hypothetical protein
MIRKISVLNLDQRSKSIILKRQKTILKEEALNEENI